MPGLFDDAFGRRGLLDLPPPQQAAQALAQLGWRALQAFAPNLTSLLAGEAPPPLANVPEMTTSGKIPSTDDPRIAGMMSEAANIGMSVMPVPGIGMGMGARWLSALMRRGASPADSMASKSAMLYHPPTKPSRPFELDYPHGALSDEAGRLAYDIEGRPIVAEHVVGRQVLGGPDEALPAARVHSVGERSVGARYTAVPARVIGRDAGRLVVSTEPGAARRSVDILYDRNLSDKQAERVIGHETGHLIHEVARRIPTTGLNTELRQVYNTLNTGQERTRHLTGPQHLGYRGDDVSRELIAEAIRAYMADPNYLKTVAPKTAAAIRDAVNSHPILSKIIQFNAIAGPAVMGIDLGSSTDPQQLTPVVPQ
jgi:hypothetical protein